MVYRNSPKGYLTNWLVTIQLLLLKLKQSGKQGIHKLGNVKRNCKSLVFLHNPMSTG